jgi:hypothetical protein
LQAAAREFVLGRLLDSLLRVDLTSPDSIQFGIGLLTFGARPLEVFQSAPSTFATTALFERLSDFLTDSDLPFAEVAISDVHVPELLYFLLPLPHEAFAPLSVLSDSPALLRAGALHLLSQILPSVKAPNAEILL